MRQRYVSVAYVRDVMKALSEHDLSYLDTIHNLSVALSEANYRLIYEWNQKWHLEEHPKTDLHTEVILPDGAPNQGMKPELEVRCREICEDRTFQPLLEALAGYFQQLNGQCEWCRKISGQVEHHTPLTGEDLYHLCADVSALIVRWMEQENSCLRKAEPSETYVNR